MLHGEAARVLWQVLDFGAVHVEAESDCVHDPFRLRRRIELVGDGLLLRSWIENRGSTPVEVCHGEHPAFARADFAVPGSSCSLAAFSCSISTSLMPPRC